MRLLSSVSLALVSLLLARLSFAQKDNAGECTCFRTNASTAYFTNHFFRDFRNVTGALKAAPRLINDGYETTDAHATSNYFLEDDWNDLWTTQSWNNSAIMEANSASTLMINSPNNVYIEASTDSDDSYSSFLTLRTARLPGFQSVSEIDSTAQNYQYVSMRFLARVMGSPGACAGIFTYLEPSDHDPDGEKVQEADIEILTSGPRNMVQYTNQPSDSASGHPKPQATVNSTNPAGRDWTLWNVYRYDWTEETGSMWYVNGESVANITYQAPKDPSTLMINMWSDGGLWTGNMSLHDEAYLQIQWMQVVFNTSGPATNADEKRSLKRDGHGVGGELMKRKHAPGCKVVCTIDEEDEIGTPKVLYNNTGDASLGWKGEGTGILGWIPLLLAGFSMFGLFGY